MPFLISGNLNRLDKNTLNEFQKKFGLILSSSQSKKQQYNMIQNSLRTKMNFVDVFSKFNKQEVLSFVFLISQFSDCITEDIPFEFNYFKNNPYILEWKKEHFMLPLEVLDYLAGEKVFKEQNYLFTLLPQLPHKEKISWLKWLGVDVEIDHEKEINHLIYLKCRSLQKPFLGKSFIHESDFDLEKLWPIGSNKFLDWYYKGIASFYFSLQELARVEKDPFFVRVIEEIKAGKYILKKNSIKYGIKESYRLVSTIEGKSLQLRNKILEWEEDRTNSKNSLFDQIENI